LTARDFAQIDYRYIGTFLTNRWEFEAERARRRQEAYLAGLDLAEGVLRSALEQLREHGIDKLQAESQLRHPESKLFISHGKETPALAKVERFVRALGLDPVIVAKGPSEGLSVDELVEKRMRDCNCVLILATADDQVEDRKQPRPNVLHEIGLAQQLVETRIIYLKEVGCEFPSNVKPKVWENFTQENMEAAFEKIIKELRSFGLL
jgi:predicted nucleotide-binding protein